MGYGDGIVELLEHGGNPNIFNKGGQTPIHVLVLREDLHPLIPLFGDHLHIVGTRQRVRDDKDLLVDSLI